MFIWCPTSRVGARHRRWDDGDSRATTRVAPIGVHVRGRTTTRVAPTILRYISCLLSVARATIAVALSELMRVASTIPVLHFSPVQARGDASRLPGLCSVISV